MDIWLESRKLFGRLALGAAIVSLSLLAGVARAGTETWSLITSPTVGSNKAQVNKLINDPTNPLIRYAVGGNGVYKTTDDGVTWSAINTGIVASPAGYIGADDLVVDPSNHDTLYAAAWSALQKSVNGGASWTVIGEASLAAIYSNTHITALAIDPVNPSNLYGATNHGMYKSADGGNTWSNMAGSAAIYTSVAIDPLDPKTLYVTTGGSARKFSVSSATDSSALIVTGIYSDPTYGYGVTALAPDPGHAGTVYAATGSGIYKSTDSGNTWVAANTCYKDSSGNTIHLLSASSIAFDPSNSSIIYIAGSSGLYKSVDGAAHWTLANVGPFGPTQVVVDLNSTNTILSGGGAFGGVYAYTYAPTVTPNDCLLNYAERTYPSYFAPAGAASAQALDYYYRYYSTTGAYLAIAGRDNHFYYYGPLTGSTLGDLGAVSGWLTTAGCQ